MPDLILTACMGITIVRRRFAILNGAIMAGTRKRMKGTVACTWRGITLPLCTLVSSLHARIVSLPSRVSVLLLPVSRFYRTAVDRLSGIGTGKHVRIGLKHDGRGFGLSSCGYDMMRA